MRSIVSSDHDDWIRRFHPVPESDFQLVCLPYAGGSASFYFPLSRILVPHVEVLAAQYPGRQDRRLEPPIENLAELADRLAEILSDYTGNDLVIFGHSMGATLGFEIVVRLEAAGVAVRGLIVSGRRAPSYGHDRDIHTLSDSALIAEIRALAGGEIPLPDDEVLRELALQSIRSDYTAIETHPTSDRRVQCPVTGIFGDHDSRVDARAAQQWAEHTSGTFTMHTLPGGHFYLVKHWPDIARIISQV